MKVIAHKLRQNLAILFTAAVCALVIFYIIKNPNLFQASILSLEEKAFMNEKHWDAAYKMSNNMLEVFVSESYKNSMKTYQGNIYYDPSKVEFLTEGLTGQWSYTIKQIDKESLLITVSSLNDITINEEIIWIPFSGDMKAIVLGESKAQTKKWRAALSIGNLNEFVTHSESP